MYICIIYLIKGLGKNAKVCLDTTHCNTLQHTATRCNTLQHTATPCNTLQHTATRMLTNNYI